MVRFGMKLVLIGVLAVAVSLPVVEEQAQACRKNKPKKMMMPGMKKKKRCVHKCPPFPLPPLPGMPPRWGCTTVVAGNTSPAAGPEMLMTCDVAETTDPFFSVDGVAIVDDFGNPTAGFLGFGANPNTSAAFEGLVMAPPPTSWSGFSSNVAGLVDGDVANVVYAVSAAMPIFPPMLNNGWMWGSAQGDLSGGNFNPDHQFVEAADNDCDVCPPDGNLDENDNDLCIVANAVEPRMLGLGDDVPTPGASAAPVAGGCSVAGHGDSCAAGALLLAALGMLISRRRRA